MVRCAANPLNILVSIALFSFFTCPHFFVTTYRSSSAQHATITLESHWHTFFCASWLLPLFQHKVFVRLHLHSISSCALCIWKCLSQKFEDGVLLPCISNSANYGTVWGLQPGHHVSKHAECRQSRHPQYPSYSSKCAVVGAARPSGAHDWHRCCGGHHSACRVGLNACRLSPFDDPLCSVKCNEQACLQCNATVTNDWQLFPTSLIKSSPRYKYVNSLSATIQSSIPFISGQPGLSSCMQN